MKTVSTSKSTTTSGAAEVVRAKLDGTITTLRLRVDLLTWALHAIVADEDVREETAGVLAEIAALAEGAQAKLGEHEELFKNDLSGVAGKLRCIGPKAAVLQAAARGGILGTVDETTVDGVLLALAEIGETAAEVARQAEGIIAHRTGARAAA